jgi:hypothetical protein
MFSPAHSEPVAEGTGDTELLVPENEAGEIDAEVPEPAPDGEDAVANTEFDRLGDEEGAPALFPEDELRLGAALIKLDCLVAVFDENIKTVFDPVRPD